MPSFVPNLAGLSLKPAARQAPRVPIGGVEADHDDYLYQRYLDDLEMRAEEAGFKSAEEYQKHVEEAGFDSIEEYEAEQARAEAAGFDSVEDYEAVRQEVAAEQEASTSAFWALLALFHSS